MIKKTFSPKFNRDVYGYDCRIGGRRRQCFGFSTVNAAELALSRARVEAFERRHGVGTPEEKPTVTVAALVARRAAQLQETRRRRTSARLLARWLDSLPNGLLVTELTTAHLQAWVDARRNSVTHETVFREVTDICSMLNNARDMFSALEDWTPTRRPRMKTPTRRRERALTRDEAARILTELQRPREASEKERHYLLRLDTADLLQIALLTAARRSEILSLLWSDVNFEWGTVQITGTKTERVRLVEMSPALVSLMQRRKVEAGRAPPPRVFPRRWCARIPISYSARRARRRASLTGETPPTDGFCTIPDIPQSRRCFMPGTRLKP